jgi:hypothetical protein
MERIDETMMWEEGTKALKSMLSLKNVETIHISSVLTYRILLGRKYIILNNATLLLLGGTYK